jgi:carboxyl-terminal processing protease
MLPVLQFKYKLKYYNHKTMIKIYLRSILKIFIAKIMTTKKINIWLPLLFSLTMIVGMFFGYKMRDTMPGKKFFSIQKANTLQEISDLLSSRYVDKVDFQNLTDTAIEAILSKLDPHTVHIPAKELEGINEDIQGSFVGIGIMYNMIADSLHVIQIVPKGPAEKAGIQVGDIILKAGDSVLSGNKTSVDKIRNVLHGSNKSTIAINLLRDKKLVSTTVTRGSIAVSSVDAHYMIDAKTGYIKLNRFTTQTYKEFMLSLMDLKKQNMQSLVLDLRDNGGGVLDEAVEIADELLAGDKLITYTEGLHTPKKEYRCRRDGQFETGNVVVLADEGSASASEVLMGALQDWDRAKIVGRRSFGKGLVQEQYDLSDRSALRLTVARYYTPLGRSIQRSYKNGSKSYYEDVSKRFVHGSMADSLNNDTTKLFTTKGGKKLFGGGGISPDYFIALDSNLNNNLARKLVLKGTISDIGYQYYLQNKTTLSQYKNAKDFVNNFTVTYKEWDFFTTLAKQDSIDVSTISQKERLYLNTNIKNAIARQLFKAEGLAIAENKEDKAILKALEILK